MNKKFWILCASIGLCFLIPFSALALSEEDYRELLKDSEFAAADKELKQAWDYAKNNLTPDEFNKLKESQREWVKSVRDESAEELIDFQGYSKVMAYISVTNERIKAIREMSGQTAGTKAPAKIQTGIVKADKDYITVIAEGYAETKQKALESAYIDAVRLAVGAIISAKTELNNDELSENIIMHSRGVIEGFDILDEKNEGGLTRLHVQAKVHREILQDETKRYIEAQTVKADTGEAVNVIKAEIKEQMNDEAKETTLQAKQKTGVELLREVLEKYGPEDFFSATLNPKIFYDKKTKKPYVQITEKFNQSVFWDEFIPKLHETLGGIATKKEKHFYTNDVRKANQLLPKTGYLIGGGVYWHHYGDYNSDKSLWYDSLPYTAIPFSWVSKEESRYTGDSDSGVYPYKSLFTLSGRWDRKEGILPERTSWKAVIPNDNASFTVYTLPVEFIHYQPSMATVPLEFEPNKGNKKRIENYRKAINTGDFTDSVGIVPLWLDFVKKMSAQVSFSITYLASNGDEINIQPIQVGSKYPVIYRSIFHDEGFYGGYVYNKSDLFYLVPACMAVAPGYVSENRHDVFLGTGNFNQKYGKGYEIELDKDELQRLDSMKFEIIFEQ